MTLRISTHHKAVSLTIPLIKMRKPQQPMIQIMMMTTKAEAVPSTARKTIDLTVADMHLSFIN